MSGTSSQKGKGTAARPGDHRGASSEKQGEQRAHHAGPDWAGGLRQLYDSIVDEPLPDAFHSLLDRLDAESGQGASDERGSGESGEAR